MHLVDFFSSATPVPYNEAYYFMLQRVRAIIDGTQNQAIWFLEHPPIYTVGTCAEYVTHDLLDNSKFPVYKTDRGGKYTYHGPGQRVVYIMLDLRKLHDNAPDIRLFRHQVEQCIIDAFAHIGVMAYTNDKGGVWVIYNHCLYKVASIGMRLKRWVSYHGVAINLSTNLSHFSGIAPCGLSNTQMISLNEMGVSYDIRQFDSILKEEFASKFNVMWREI